MPSRDRVELTVTFGPTSSPLVSRARSYARAHATTSAEIAPGIFRAAFTLQGDPEPYGRAYRLLQMVGTWKATEVVVNGLDASLPP